MSAHKYIDRICLIAAVLSLVLAALFVNGEALGIQAASQAMGYEERLFDTSRVHTIDIVMDDWDAFLETCENEEYASCAVVIDGEAYRNVALRAKGNTSLTTVSSLGSDRYSFKIEFDHYDAGSTYYGLDKLCLNNIIQDNTYMKDYLTYQLMAEFGVNAPLCSYVYITVNGEDWGLYLAVEGVEDAFLQRNYGSQSGELYKPDSMSFGGGRGNGQDFRMDDFMDAREDSRGSGGAGEGFALSAMPDGQAPGRAGSAEDGGALDGQTPDSAGPSGTLDGLAPDNAQAPGGGGGPGGMGSDDVKLQYIDDDPDSYSNIFTSAKTDITAADQTRLIAALKALGEGDVSALDMDQVLRYFAVHNFVCNGDSYTGSMVHNYYLYESDGQLSMIPWDYNLAFGTFQAGDASSAVNDPIDTPQSVTGSGDRPMIDWIFASEEYTALYHQYLAEFLSSVDIAAIIDQTQALIAPYVEKDPTKFCTYEEFETGAAALKTFCQLRAESVSGQLAGDIPSTSAGQAAAPDTLVDTAGLTLSDMGSMNNAGPGGDIPAGGFSGGGFPGGGGGHGGQPNASPPDDGTAPDGEGFPAPSSDGNALGQGGPGQPDGGGFSNDPADTDGALPDQTGEGADGVQLGRGNRGGGFPGGDGAAPGGGTLSGAAPGLSGTALLTLGGCILALLAGLLLAFCFKRNGRGYRQRP